MKRSFGLDAAALFEELRAAVERFKADDLDRTLARECAAKAWHLCDHVYKALGSDSRFQNLQNLQASVRESCPELGYLQTICIDYKHGEVRKPRIEEARLRVGDFSREDFNSDDFHTSRLEILLPGGQVVPFNDVIDRAVDFWARFMEEQGVQ